MHTIWVWCPSKSRAVIFSMGPVCLKDIPHASGRRRWTTKKSKGEDSNLRPFPGQSTNHFPHCSIGWQGDLYLHPTGFLFEKGLVLSVSQKKTLTCSNLEEFCLRGRCNRCGFHEIQEARASHVSNFVHPKNRPMSFDEISSLGTLQISWLPNRKAY